MGQHYTARKLRWRCQAHSDETAHCKYGTFFIAYQTDDESCFHSHTIFFTPKGEMTAQNIGYVSLSVGTEPYQIAQEHFQALHEQHMRL